MPFFPRGWALTATSFADFAAAAAVPLRALRLALTASTYGTVPPALVVTAATTAAAAAASLSIGAATASAAATSTCARWRLCCR